MDCQYEGGGDRSSIICNVCVCRERSCPGNSREAREREREREGGTVTGPSQSEPEYHGPGSSVVTV